MHTTSPRKDAEISENYRKPAERNHSKEISTSPANALKILSRIFCGPSFLLLCMETHDMMDLAAVKETGKYEFTEIKDMDYIRDRKSNISFSLHDSRILQIEINEDKLSLNMDRIF